MHGPRCRHPALSRSFPSKGSPEAPSSIALPGQADRPGEGDHPGVGPLLTATCSECGEAVSGSVQSEHEESPEARLECSRALAVDNERFAQRTRSVIAYFARSTRHVDCSSRMPCCRTGSWRGIKNPEALVAECSRAMAGRTRRSPRFARPGV